MKILIACEESQRVCIEFRNRGHEAYSCDVIECSGGHPERHIQQDVLPLLNGKCSFTTLDGETHTISHKWDMIIAFPPCTHLATSGAAWFKQKREDGRQEEGIRFFCQFLTVDCDKVVIENPVNIIGGQYVTTYFPELAKQYNLPNKPSQFIHPYFFGDAASKKTGLWLKGVPPLTPTKIVEPEIVTITTSDGKTKNFPKWHYDSFYAARKDRGKIRGKTWPGIARAMAEQWG